jgi:hypothetical protein
MPKPESKTKKRRTVLEGFNNVPQLLEEARQAVDEVSQGPPEPRAEEARPAPRGRKTGPRRPQAVPRKTSARETGPGKKPSRSPASRAKAAAPVTPPAETPDRPLLGLRDCGIRVKHAIPGRIRLGLYKMLHNQALAEQLPPLLTAVPGVTAAAASPATGSLLITFNPGDLAAAKAHRDLSGVMQRFFPGLDTESLIRRMLGE